jgi:hypothetical protein
MLPRKPLRPNNRSLSTLKREFKNSGALYVSYPKTKESSSIFHYARAGRQNSEGFGGGNRVTK